MTILVAGGLYRRPSPREIGAARHARVPAPLPRPADRPRRRGRGPRRARRRRRRRRSRVAPCARRDRPRRHRDRGRDRARTAARRRSCAPARARCCARSGATSLLETSSSQGWTLARRARAAARRARAGLRRLARAQPPARLRRLPVRGADPRADRALEAPPRPRAAARRPCAGSMIERVPRELTAAAVLGGTPSAAHTEALLRAIEFKGATLDEPLDAIVIGIPPTTPFLPRELPEPRLGRLPRARARAAALAERVPGAGRAARRSCSTTSCAASRPRSRRRTARSSPTRARPATATRCARPSAPRSPTSGRSPSTAPGRSVHPLEPFLTWSACDAAAEPARARADRRLPRRARRAPARLRPGAQRRRCARRWRAGAARSGSGSCSRRRTSRSSSRPRASVTSQQAR